MKASENFMNFQRTLNEVASQLSAARRAYNSAVVSSNNAVEMFPTNIMARLMGYMRKQVFEAKVEERENVNVKKLFQS